MNFLVTAISTCGVGFSPRAPGTVGSILALFLWWFFYGFMSWELIVVTFIVGTISTHFYEKWNDRHDPKEVVIDEVIGLWITLYMATPQLSVMLFGFLLFRLFDIWKPFPIGWADRKLPGALGTMVDDVLAGLAGFVCLWSLEHYGILY